VPTHLEREDRTHRQAPHRIGIPHLGVLLLDLIPSDTQVRRIRLALVHESSSVVDDGLEPASLEVEVLDLLLQPRRRAVESGADERAGEDICLLGVQTTAT
jgi:hypothetical protein